jgi:hypothetical protein
VRLLAAIDPQTGVKKILETAEVWADTGKTPADLPAINEEHSKLLSLGKGSLNDQLQVQLAGMCLSTDCQRRFWFWWSYGHMQFQPRSAFAQAYRELFANPFLPLAWKPEWFTSTVRELAAHICDARDFAAMPILADALQDAGCDDEQVLNHCRANKPHARGCWVVDAILGKS